MTSLDQRKREPLLDEKGYQWSANYHASELLPDLYRLLHDPKEQDDRPNLLRRIAVVRLKDAISAYSAGEPIERVKALWAPVIDSFESFIDEPNTDLQYIDLADPEVYVEAMWLLALTALLGFGLEDIKRVVDLYGADETNDGADDLFELICGKLCCNSFFADDGVIHEAPYLHLLKCVQARPEERPRHMRAFLEHWYGDQKKECGWCGLHVKRPGQEFCKSGFFGYWAFEAALVTYLWDIDDTTYRDMRYYPKDLVDYARTHHANHPAPGSAHRC